MVYTYSYLLLDVFYGLIWFALFAWKKHCRREMVIISLPFGILGLALNWLYVQDWWYPLTITGTIPAIEDFLYGFFLGGIAAVIAESFRSKELTYTLLEKHKRMKRLRFFWVATLASIVMFYFTYFLLHINTFWISLFITFFVLGCIYYKRPDLLNHSLRAGFFLVIVNVVAYSIVNFLTPGWVEAFWYFKFFPKLIILNVPLEDIFFYFAFGAAVGPLYEYWQEGRLRKK